MATKDARGTKRTCQSSECGARFYDLHRDPIVCPICGTIYELAHAPAGAILDAEPTPARKPKKAEMIEAAEPVAAEGEELADIDAIDAEEDIADGEEADDTFLEDDEEDGDNVSGILGGSRAEGEEDEV